jgi:hypothetical protein
MILFTGCGIFKSSEPQRTEPKLLKQSALPHIPSLLQKQGFDFYCEMLISENGVVELASIIKSSGDKDWDSLAAISLMEWQFSPALSDNKPIRTLIRRKVNVEFVEPNSILLAEIICNTESDAASAYFDLKNGMDFGKAAEKYSISDSKNNAGIIGKVDIQHYTGRTRQILSRLKENEFTESFAYGKYFAIFKRLKED